MQDRLRFIRLYRHYTQQQIADRLGISRSAYTLYELGKRQLPSDILIQLADFYHVSVDFLLGR